MATDRPRLLAGSLAGLATSLLLWARDLAGLTRLQFAGVSDAASEAAVREGARGAVMAMEGRLLLLHAVVGAVLGLLAALAMQGRGRRPRLATAGAAAGAVLAVSVLALGGMMASYPQVYADRWWLAGGARAFIQRVVTHVLGPWPFDVALALVLAVLAGAAARPAAARARRALRRPRPAVAAAAAVVLALGAAAALPGPRARASATGGARPNVIILAVDSLRADRVESEAVMPFTAGLARRSAFWTHAYAPIARTFQSWVSTLTATEPRVNGVRTMFPRHEDREDLGATFVSELRDRGYDTFVVSDFAGDIFPRFRGGFGHLDTPDLTLDTLAASTLLGGHDWALPVLRLAAGRALFPEWRNLPNLSDPSWLAARALRHVDRAGAAPFAGVVFFSTAHFPFAAPYPFYREGSAGERGPFLYHVPPSAAGQAPDAAQERQVRARYDAALRAVDQALREIHGGLVRRGQLERTVVVVMGDHGEELFDRPGIFGHGDVIGLEHSQAAPLLIHFPALPPARSDDQVRLLDLGPTVLDLTLPEGAPHSFADGVTLLKRGVPRPLCVETGMWFWPTLPAGLRGQRLTYPGIAALLEVDPRRREMVLRADRVPTVESLKERGIVLGNRYRSERPTPTGRLVSAGTIPGVTPAFGDTDLSALFEQRCVAGDPKLLRLLGGVVWNALPDVAPLP